MRLRNSTGETVTSGLEDSTAFSIKVNGKAFKILLDGLYSDKIGAIIRELSTNAYDAHLAIGKGDVPFLVKLPTYFDPTFRVRDYGVSMTHEQAKRLLATVFESSKDNSNNQIGAFGLGSKSPFSLVESYTITVWKDGEKRMYLAHYNSDGVPDLALLGREASADPTGVEFALTVNPKDSDAFAERAKRILRFFPTFPTIEGQAIKLTAPEYTLSGKGWSLFKTERPGALARQGCVVYPLNASSIPNITPDQSALLAANILIDFPIGSLDVAASRESLSYEPTTCANIIARLNTVVTEVTDMFGKAISDAPTMWEAAAKRESVWQSDLPRSLVGVVQATKWQGKIIPQLISYRDMIETFVNNSLNVRPHYWDNYRLRRFPTAVHIGFDSMHAGNRASIYPGQEKYAFYFTVEGSEPQHEGKRIRTDVGAANVSVTLFVVPAEADKDKVMEILGNPPNAKWTKDLPAPVTKPRAPAAKRGTTKKEQVKVREVIPDPDPKAAPFSYVLGLEKIVDLHGDASYLITKDNKVTGVGPYRGTDTMPIGKFVSTYSIAARDGFIDAKVPTYFVSVVYQKRVEDFPDWKHLTPTLKDKMVTGLEDRLFDEALKSSMHRAITNSYWVKFITTQKAKALATSLGSGALFDFHKFLEDSGILTWKLNTNRYGNFLTPEHDKLSNMRWFGVDPYTMQEAAQKRVRQADLVKKFETLSANCNVKYPLIGGGQILNHSGETVRNCLEYIEALDQMRASKAAAAKPTSAPPPQVSTFGRTILPTKPIVAVSSLTV